MMEWIVSTAIGIALVVFLAGTLSLGHEVIVVAGDRALLPALAAAGVTPELLAEPAEPK